MIATPSVPPTSSPTAPVVQLIVAVICGGLGGAIFTWWANRKFRMPPVLRLRLTRKEGERVKINAPGGMEDGRFFHVTASNSRRWSPAHDVQIFLTRLDEPGPDGTFHPTWVGDLPMRWRNQESGPLTRTIGHEYDSDICSVTKGQRLQIMSLILPFNLNPVRTGACRLALFLQARSTEADSPMYRLEISWDGLWEDGDTEIQKHLTIRIDEQAKQ